MLRTITPAEMKRVEQRVMNETPVTSEMLMAAAAVHVANAVSKQSENKVGVVWCLCGTGNNGGDGMAALRMLCEQSPMVRGVCWVLDGDLSPDATRELDRLVKLSPAPDGTPRATVIRVSGNMLPPPPHAVSCIIDALFGTGLSRPLGDIAAQLVKLSNELHAKGVPVVAVDIPSGLHGETGHALGAMVHATQTITFHRPKLGLFLRDGLDACGQVTVADIGIPATLDDANGYHVLTSDDFARLLPPRKRQTHKGSYGRVLLWAGSIGMAGATAIAATAALRTGAGLVTVACPDEMVATVQALCPCATCVPLSTKDVDSAWQSLSEAASRADALGIGCGLGKADAAAELLKRLLGWLSEQPKPCILDADALNLLAASDRKTVLPKGTFLTPHPAEAARLLGCETATVVEDPISAAAKLRDRYCASVLVKGATTVLTDTNAQTALNPYGTPAMAKGGSGDALTGVLAALLAGRVAGGMCAAATDSELMQVACALHGTAGVLAQRQYGERGVLATDLCACLGLVTGEELIAPPLKSEQPHAAVASPLGRMVTITVEQPVGSHPADNSQCVYTQNFGHVQEELAEAGIWQDAYIYGVKTPVEWFEGEVVAVLNREGGKPTAWVVAEAGTRPSADEIQTSLSATEPNATVETL